MRPTRSIEEMKENLIKFLIVKDSLLPVDDFIVQEDLNEIADWSDADIIHTYLMLRSNFSDDSYLYNSDTDICPWCIYVGYEDNCAKCAYGARHGICYNKESSYKKLISYIKNILGGKRYISIVEYLEPYKDQLNRALKGHEVT